MGRKRGAQYRKGSFYRSDDRSGFTRRAEETQQEWNQLIVAKDLWEPRQPQDLVKGVPDDQTVPQPRPIPPAIWDGPLYFQLTQSAAIGDRFLYLQYIAGITIGDDVGVMLDSGVYFNSVVSDISSLGITIEDALTFTAASGNMVVDYGTVSSVSPGVENARITEDGAIRVTEDGDIRSLLP